MNTAERQLREENEMLRERVRQLESELVPAHFSFPVKYRLTGSEAVVLRRLMATEVASPRSIILALYSDRSEDYPEPSIVNVWICKIRKKLRPFGISIQNIWGEGYRLENRHLITVAVA